MNRWVYTVVMDDEATIIKSEVRRYFRDLNFTARHVPLKAENFAVPNDFIKAARELLGDRPSAAQIRSLMEKAGLNPGRPHGAPFEKTSDPHIETLEFYGAGTPILFFVTGCTNTIHVIWTLDKRTGLLGVRNPEEFHTALGACL